MRRLFYSLVAVAGLLLIVIGGQTEAMAQSGDSAADVTAGQTVYSSNCAGCHGADGTGVAGLGRPLIGIATQGDRSAHIDAITNGKGSMPAFGERLSVDEVGQAASYVRLTFVEESASTDTELAMTGVSSLVFTIVGLSMLIGGWLMLLWSRTEQAKAGFRH